MSTPASFGPATGAENVAAVEQAVLHEAIWSVMLFEATR